MAHPHPEIPKVTPPGGGGGKEKEAKIKRRIGSSNGVISTVAQQASKILS